MIILGCVGIIEIYFWVNVANFGTTWARHEKAMPEPMFSGRLGDQAMS